MPEAQMQNNVNNTENMAQNQLGPSKKNQNIVMHMPNGKISSAATGKNFCYSHLLPMQIIHIVIHSIRAQIGNQHTYEKHKSRNEQPTNFSSVRKEISSQHTE